MQPCVGPLAAAPPTEAMHFEPVSVFDENEPVSALAGGSVRRLSLWPSGLVLVGLGRRAMCDDDCDCVAGPVWYVAERKAVTRGKFFRVPLFDHVALSQKSKIALSEYRKSLFPSSTNQHRC